MKYTDVQGNGQKAARHFYYAFILFSSYKDYIKVEAVHYWHTNWSQNSK